MGLDNQESKEEERRLEDKKMEDADKLVKKEAPENAEGKEGRAKELGDIASKAGNSLYENVSKTRQDSVGSGGISEKAEFQDKAGPFLAKYETEVRKASGIEDPEDRKKALESAYNSLSDELEGIKGTQEGRDAQGDKHREREEKKTAEEKNRDRTLKFSEAMLKAAKEIEVDRRLAEIERRVKERAELSKQTAGESKEAMANAQKEIAASFV